MASAEEKILSLQAAASRREALRTAGRKVVLTNGVFDLLHEGHRHYLERARALGDALFVAMNSDASTRRLKGPERPVQGQAVRARALAELPWVDAVIVFDGLRFEEEIARLRPDVYCKAADYSLDKLDPGERAALQAAGTRIEFLPFLPGHSTTATITRLKAEGKL